MKNNSPALSSPYRHLIHSIASSSRKPPAYVAKRSVYSDSPYTGVSSDSVEGSPAARTRLFSPPSSGVNNATCGTSTLHSPTPSASVSSNTARRNGDGRDGSPEAVSSSTRESPLTTDKGDRGGASTTTLECDKTEGNGSFHSTGGPSDDGATSATPPSLWRRYEAFLLRNVNVVTQVETAVSSLLFMLPSRFGGGPDGDTETPSSELRSEALYSAVRLISLVNDAIVMRRALHGSTSIRRQLASTDGGKPGTTTEHALLFALSTVRTVELCAETASLALGTGSARQRHNRRWRTVLLVEIVKAVLRLCLLAARRGRMLVRQDLATRDELVGPAAQQRPAAAAAALAELRREADRLLAPDSHHHGGTDALSSTVPGGATGVLPNDRPRPTLADQPRKGASSDGADSANSSRLRGAGLAGELLWIVRPVAYASLHVIRRTGGAGTTAAWLRLLFAVACDMAAHRLSTSHIQRRSRHEPSSSASFAGAESRELNRRRTLWLLYGLHSPAFELLSSVASEFRQTLLDPIPGIGTLFRIIGQYLSAMNRMYFFHSGS